MPGYGRQRCWAVPWRQSFARRYLSQSTRHVSDTDSIPMFYHKWRAEDIDLSLQPLPTNILRFALRGTTVANKPNKKPAELPQKLEDAFDTDWSSDAAALPAFWSQQQKMFDKATWEKFYYGLRFKVRSIPHLQVFIQRYIYDKKAAMLLQEGECSLLATALDNCQRYHSYQELLAVLNAIIGRIQNLGGYVTKELRALAIYYGALAFSAAAMRPHVKALGNQNKRLQGNHSSSIVTALTFSLHSLEPQQSQQDIESMCRFICLTGDPKRLKQHDLHPRLSWSKTVPNQRREVHLPLLAELGMNDLLDSAWENTMQSELSGRNLGPIYLCTVYMIKAGNSPKALAYLKQLSELFDGTLPNISKMKYLNVLLEDQEIGEALPRLVGEQERLGILAGQLQVLEQRLGARWNPEKSVHVGFSDPYCNATENPLFDMDGETAGYDSSERLVAEIKTLGCSKSVEDLRKIADLLDEHEGQLVPIATQYDPELAFAWHPERSPIKFSDTAPTLQTDLSKPCPVSSLGLVRARLDGNRISPAQYPLRIIQLGRVLVRRVSQPKGNRWIHMSFNWKPTSHIVGWDRVHARFVLVSAGPAKWSEQRYNYMECASIVPMPGCLEVAWDKPWVISALQQPLRKFNIKACLEEDPGLDLVE